MRKILLCPAAGMPRLTNVLAESLEGWGRVHSPMLGTVSQLGQNQSGNFRATVLAMRARHLQLGFGLAAAVATVGGCGGSYTATPATTAAAAVSRQIAAPIDVRTLPYYNDSWTLTRDGNDVTVQTNMYRDDEGRQLGWVICNQTWGDLRWAKDVMVLAADGGPLAHRWYTSDLPTGGACEKG